MPKHSSAPVPLPVALRSVAARAACAAVALAGVFLTPAGARSAPAQAAPTARIVIKDFGFSPASLTVAPGTVVTVVNRDNAPHTLTGTGRATFDTGRVKAGRSATFTAPRARGQYAYICDIHQFMSGSLTVR
ncbi:cupredoxin domain-containing protein [Streptomyces sp. NBC_01264]|uniref:cupredoxin domain-containing protein n=1 Tax=Streptomyces sp. NBC_01264 TaxID=2903804 RepID=UPI00224E2EF0|nr:cupredoxin domain-containing protein [Streptomyces sp. NBC_01264]MCX4776614.1 cupredoxin domain-containing protein [Streptomyces sp. NBC_01264]